MELWVLLPLTTSAEPLTRSFGLFTIIFIYLLVLTECYARIQGCPNKVSVARRLLFFLPVFSNSCNEPSLKFLFFPWMRKEIMAASCRNSPKSQKHRNTRNLHKWRSENLNHLKIHQRTSFYLPIPLGTWSQITWKEASALFLKEIRTKTRPQSVSMFFCRHDQKQLNL